MPIGVLSSYNKKKGKKSEQFTLLAFFPLLFMILRIVHRSAQSLFHCNLDRILTHFGDNQRLGNGIRGCNLIYYPLINLV